MAPSGHVLPLRRRNRPEPLGIAAVAPFLPRLRPPPFEPIAAVLDHLRHRRAAAHAQGEPTILLSLFALLLSLSSPVSPPLCSLPSPAAVVTVAPATSKGRRRYPLVRCCPARLMRPEALPRIHPVDARMHGVRVVTARTPAVAVLKIRSPEVVSVVPVNRK